MHQVEGVNLVPQPTTDPFDIHCPLMQGTGRSYKQLNYWEAKCRVRNQDKTLKKTCYPKCKMLKPTLFKTLDRNVSKGKTAKGREWLVLREAGVLMRKIADQEGVSPATVYRYITAAKMERAL